MRIICVLIFLLAWLAPSAPAVAVQVDKGAAAVSAADSDTLHHCHHCAGCGASCLASGCSMAALVTGGMVVETIVTHAELRGIAPLLIHHVFLPPPGKPPRTLA